MYKKRYGAAGSKTTPETMTGIRFLVNGKEHVVRGDDLPASTSLNEYLRETAGLKGTKVMCREAGCGCCAVTVSHGAPDADTLKTYSVQSCLTPLYAVDGWQISTVEGIGSQKKGFHPIQKRIAEFNGTQCGYCTPGMVMNMYGLLHQNPNITAQQIEDSFDGNICRCTGYRPILDAMKSFAADANIPGAKAIDIEDLNKNLCPKTGEQCAGTCRPRSLGLDLVGVKWFRPLNLNELFKHMSGIKGKKTRLFFGNTSAGIFKNEGPYDVYIDIHGVKELYSFQATNTSVRLGAATTLTQYMNHLESLQGKPGFHYCTHLLRHLKVVANVMVRNSGSIGGNLMIKYHHKDFPSDIFTTLEGAGATVEIADSCGKRSNATLLDFLTKIDMSNKVLVAVILPSISDSTVYRSFKITPRWQNAHAYINMAFRIPVDGLNIKGKPAIVVGGISANTVHCSKTEAFLTNKALTPALVKEACRTLRDELVPEESQLESSAKYRKDLASGLLYKVLLAVHNDRGLKLRSGPDHMTRPMSSGMQTYQEKKEEFPIKQGMPKKTAPLQASGEAQYVNDIPKFQQELFAAYVLTEVSSADLESLDASEALKMPGVARFLSAKDVVGSNNVTIDFGGMPLPPHELFVSKTVSHAGQALGAILAETQAQALAAAKKVKVTYANVKPPVLTIDDSEAAGQEFAHGRKDIVKGNPEDALKNSDKIVEGVVKMGAQYHFFMETHVAVAVPSEDGIDVHSATQFGDMVQHACAHVLGQPLNYINVTIPRIGGGFGGKAFDANQHAAAAALGAFLTDRPVRIALDLESTIKMGGKRPPFVAKYKAGFTKEGEMKVIDLDFHTESGYTPLGAFVMHHSLDFLDMGYSVPNWNVRGKIFINNKKTVMPVRAPGSVPAALIIETIMEHVAHSVGKHSTVVKEMNLYKDGETDLKGTTVTPCTLREMWRRLKDTAEVAGRIRQVEAFNQDNAWKKRGLAMTTCKYGMRYGGIQAANVSIFSKDGSVVVSQGGVEMGQGLYTKVAQGVAHVLGVPIETIKVRPNQNLICPNNYGSGGSTTSEASMEAAIGAAEILKERIRPIREKHPDLSWAKLCEMCTNMKVDLGARHTVSPPNVLGEDAYFTYCAAVTETEVDILTGESQIRRVDIMADYGESLNPVIDIGQTEGGFVFGLGAYLSEDTVYDKETGKILSDGTWNYKPPTTKDIPIDWRIHLLPDSPNTVGGIRSSKACGEPSTGLACGALLANKMAIEAARKDLFGAEDFLPVVAPFTVERAQQSVGLNDEIFAV